MIEAADLEPLLGELRNRDTHREHLVFVDTLTCMQLSPDAWRAVSGFTHHLLAHLVEAKGVSAETLAVLAATPLMSVRDRLRRMTESDNREHALAAALALAAQHDAGGLARLLNELQQAPNENIARAIASLPSEALQSATVNLKAALAVENPMVRMWIAIALAKAYTPGSASGNLEPLEQLWDSLVRPPEFFLTTRLDLYFREPPPLFHGDPKHVASELAHAKKLPPHVLEFLLGLMRNDFDYWTPKTSLVATARDAKVLIAGLTGAFDTDGDAVVDSANVGLAPPTAGNTVAAMQVLVRLKDQPWRELEVGVSADELAQLKFVPPTFAAQLLEQSIAVLPSQAQPVNTPPPWAFGNAMLHLAGALPKDIPLRIVPIIDDTSITKMIPRPMLAWTLGRAGADNLWRTMAPYAAAMPTQRRGEYLRWIRDIAHQIDAPAPFAGAGGESATQSIVSNLIDDMPRAAARSAPPAIVTGASSPSILSRIRKAMRAVIPTRPTEEYGSGVGSDPGSALPPQLGAEPPPSSSPPDEKPPERFLQGDLYRKSGDAWLTSENELVLNSRYKLDVFIGASGQGAIQADVAFPDDELDWQDANQLELRVVLTVLDGRSEAQTGVIRLPRTGKSSTCSFEFEPQRPGTARIRIVVLYDGRILQTAIIDAEVVKSLKKTGTLTFRARTRQEMIVHDFSDLKNRRPFGASLLLNHTSSGSATATATAGDGAYVSSLDKVQSQLETISGLLQEIANKSKLHTKKLRTDANESWLALMAREGHYVHTNLVVDYIGSSAAAQRLKEAHYLQIVTARPDAVVPLEFAYEYGFPNKNAKLCKDAEAALKAGRCPKTCQLKDNPEDFVCPLGFWGLSKVIERHAFDPTLPAQAVIRSDQNSSRRKQLVLRGPSLLAASNEVPKKSMAELEAKLKSVWHNDVSVVGDWKKWLQAVKQNPALFVVLPHSAGEGTDLSLEINGHLIESARIMRPYVYPEGSTGSPPIVLLLGCNTTGVADMKSYATHITVFRQAQSAIVLATTAVLVWGADIAKVAEELLDQFQEAARDSEDCFGDILRNAKCQSVLESQLVAICLAAFGDADWRLALPNAAANSSRRGNSP